MIHKKILLILIPIIFFTPIESFSQTINYSSYAGFYNVKPGNYRDYKYIHVQFGNITQEQTSVFNLEDGSLASFNYSNSYSFRLTVTQINQTKGQQHVYVQESMTTHYENLETRSQQYGTIHGNVLDAFSTGFLYPSFPNKTMANNFYLNTFNETEVAINGNDLTLSINYSNNHNMYLDSWTFNWKTGWLQEENMSNVYLIKMVHPSFISSLLNSTLPLLTISSSILILSTLVLLTIKYKKFKTNNPRAGKNSSFIDYTKGLVKQKITKRSTSQKIDIDKSLQTLEEIIEENK